MSLLSRMTVFYLGPFEGWGARERGLIREARQAKMLGINVVICCPLESYIHVEARRFGLETFPLRLVRPGRWFNAYRDVFKFLHRRHNFTHFHCYDSNSIFSAAQFLRVHPEVSLLWSIHGTPPVLGSSWWQKILLARVDRFLLPSSLSLARISRQFGVSAHKIARLGLAIDQQELDRTPPGTEIFYVGSSLPDHRDCLNTVSVALRALAVAHGRGLGNIRLLLHNPRDWNSSLWREQIQEMVLSHQLEESVELISGEDFSQFSGRLHLTLAPEGEEVPYDHIEISLLAMVPVIHPRNRSYRELLHDITSGIYSYKPHDARELSEKLIKLYNHWGESREAMTELKQQHGHWHDPIHVRQKLQQIYERTILRRKKYWLRLGHSIGYSSQ